MKKIMKIFVLVAAAMTLASCQKNEINGPVSKEVHFTIKADFADTKTSITDNGDRTYTPSWAKGDRIGVLFALEEDAKAEDFENTAEAGEEATFEGKHAFTVEGATEVDGYLYAFYPSSAFNKVYKDGGVRLDLKATQYPTSTSFDPSCDLLIAKPCHYVAEVTGADAEVLIDDMYFARMMSVLRINLNSEFLSNETVKSISFDADGVDFTGAMKFNLETGEFVGNQSTSQDLSEVKAIYSAEDPIYVDGQKNSAYLVLAPVTIPSGTTLTFAIETENYDIVKTITAPADMVMPAGNIAVINLTIAEENCTAKVEDTSDYSGEWLITGVNEGQVYAAGAYVSGKNNLNVTVPITISDKKINEVDGLAACKMLITKISEGDYAGLYTIQDSNELYLYAASSSSNHLKASTTINANSYWAIAENTDGTYSVVATESSNRNVMQFNYNNASPIFSCYASESMSAVTLYPYSYVQPDTTPRIIVAEEALTQNVDADATELSFNYSLKNISGVPTATVAAGATMTNVSATADNGTVTVTFAANEEESPKTATVTLSYEGAEPVSVTITQAAKAAEETDVAELVIDMTAQGYANQQEVTSVKAEPIIVDFNKGTNSNTPKYYTSGTAVRVYGGGYFTVSSEKTIVKIVVTFGSSDGSNAITTDCGSYSNGTWTGSASSVKFSIGGTSGNRRIQKLTITYQDAGGSETPETPSMKTYTLTISPSDFNSTSYAANNNEKTSTATASDGSTMEVKWSSNQVMLQSGVMQWQKSNGYIYNSTDLGTITNIEVTSSAGTFTNYIGTSSQPTSEGSGGYFQIKTGTSATGKTSKVVVTFQK